MNPSPSLRLRLLMGGAAWIVAALAASWLFIFVSFSQLIDSERRDDLEASLNRIVAEIDPEATPPVADGPLTDPRYDTPLSGVYWQVKDLETGVTERSRSLWDTELAATPPPDGQTELTQLALPDRPLLIVLTRIVRMERADGTERRFLISVGEERSTEDDPVEQFGTNLALFLGILGGTLIMAAAVQVHFGLRPLGTLRGNIAAVRAGQAERLPEDVNFELKPVAEEIKRVSPIEPFIKAAWHG